MQLVALVCVGWTVASAGHGPQNLRCEWVASPARVGDTCPEFYWEVPSQSALELTVAESADGFAKPVWHVKQSGRLPIVEYAGPPLAANKPYFWKVHVWDAEGRELPESAVAEFTVDAKPAAHYLPSIRTFVNFAGAPDWAKDKIDLCFRKEAKQGRPDILVTQYALICTLVEPSAKADGLAAFCRSRGYELEDCFCHYAVDTPVTLHVGAEQASRPRETRVCRGWDPRNDRNGDGRVDAAERAQAVNPRATAAVRREARVPIYYWGPPRDDYVMNVGHPGYREFMAEVYSPGMAEGYDGLYFDTLSPRPLARGPLVEYPPEQAGHWLEDLQLMLARIKLRMPEKIVSGNGWRAEPMVIDGFQRENWLNLGHSLERWKRAIDEACAVERRGKMQWLQYNPIYDPELAEFGPKVEGVARDRDALYGLASYWLVHGDRTWFGFGSHPYARVTKLWFKAIEHDIGRPEGEYFLFHHDEDRPRPGAKNLLAGGDFEQAGRDGLPAGWKTAPPLALDAGEKHSGRSSVRITSNSVAINNICRQSVTLKPHTTYTLRAWIKTDNVQGSPGANVYAYEFDGMKADSQTIAVAGSTPWKLYRQIFTTGDDGQGRINFRMYGATGTAWLDDLELMEGAVTSNDVYGRRFTRGLVLVKPCAGGTYDASTASRHELPEALRLLAADGRLAPPARSVTLRAGEAAILVRP